MHFIFDEFLRRQEIQYNNLPEVLKNRMNQWLTALKSLYQSVNSFLKPFIDSKRVDTILSDYVISEKELGNYCVETMKIVIPGNVTAKLVPVGAYVFGGRGRVDLLGPTEKQVQLLHVPANMTKDGIHFQFNGNLSANDKTKLVAEEKIEWIWKIASHHHHHHLLLLELDETNFLDALVFVYRGLSDGLPGGPKPY